MHINDEMREPWEQDDIDAELGNLLGTLGKIVSAPANIVSSVAGKVGGAIGGKTGAQIGRTIGGLANPVATITNPLGAARSLLAVAKPAASAVSSVLKPAAKVIGAIAGKPVVSLSGQTQMTASGQLASGTSVSKPIAGACGTTTTASIAATAGIREIPRLVREQLEPQLKPITNMLALAQTQREATSEHNSIMSRRDFQGRVIADLDALARCGCNKPAMSSLARFRAAFGF